jgi:hypothetical protein
MDAVIKLRLLLLNGGQQLTQVEHHPGNSGAKEREASGLSCRSERVVLHCNLADAFASIKIKCKVYKY